MSFYKRIRIKEVCLEIKDEYESIPFASIVRFTEKNIYERKLFTNRNKNNCIDIVYNVIVSSIVNLILSKKLKVVYFKDRYSLMFGIIKFESEGFILKLSQENVAENDLFSRDVLLYLISMPKNDNENVSNLIKKITNNYFNSNTISEPELTFVEKYLTKSSKEYEWLEVKTKHYLTGIPIRIEVKIASSFLYEIKNYYKTLDENQLNEIGKNILLKHFINDLEEKISSEFKFRSPVTDD